VEDGTDRRSNILKMVFTKSGRGGDPKGGNQLQDQAVTRNPSSLPRRRRTLILTHFRFLYSATLLTDPGNGTAQQQATSCSSANHTSIITSTISCKYPATRKYNTISASRKRQLIHHRSEL
jgi:hypothetical protein